MSFGQSLLHVTEPHITQVVHTVIIITGAISITSIVNHPNQSAAYLLCLVAGVGNDEPIFR
jgi:hypothetical protein